MHLTRPCFSVLFIFHWFATVSQVNRRDEEDFGEYERPSPILHGHDHDHGAAISWAHSTAFVAYTVMIALCIHAFLAGLSLGVDETLGGALLVFIAIAAHKFAEAAALSSVFQQQRVTRLRSVILLTVFALMTPLGIVTGMVLVAKGQAEDGGLAAIFTAMASGTFLYVSVADILLPELHKERPALKLALMLLGFAVMAVVAIWT